MNDEEMRRRRKLYLMTHTKSSMALDELGEVKDPIAATGAAFGPPFS